MQSPILARGKDIYLYCLFELTFPAILLFKIGAFVCDPCDNSCGVNFFFDLLNLNINSKYIDSNFLPFQIVRIGLMLGNAEGNML